MEQLRSDKRMRSEIWESDNFLYTKIKLFYSGVLPPSRWNDEVSVGQHSLTCLLGQDYKVDCHVGA